jgi:hypothetical protein
MTVYDDMFKYIHNGIAAEAKKMTQLNEDDYFAVNSVPQWSSQCYAEVGPMTDTLLISAHIPDPFWQLRLSSKGNHRMDINPEGNTSYSIQYKEVLQKCFAYECSPKHRRVSITEPAKI